MSFQENLVRIRKQRGFTQEKLAERIGFSRQAISKWETGESLPDLHILTALAEILDVSLDSLCDRKDANGASEATALKPAECSRTVRRWPLILLAVFTLLIGVTVGYFVEKSQKETYIPTLPDIITAKGITFSNEEGTLVCQFVPSVTGKEYLCRLSSNPGQETADVSMEAGGCTGRLSGLELGQNYTITATISNGRQSRNLCLAVNLSLDAQNGVSWQPISY